MFDPTRSGTLKVALRFHLLFHARLETPSQGKMSGTEAMSWELAFLVDNSRQSLDATGFLQ